MNLKKNSPLERIINGIYTENPSLVLLLGMCPMLATSTSVTNAVGMGLSTTAILALSNLIISLLRKIIPEKMRMPAYIVVIASFVTMIDFLMEGFTPELYSSLGIYIPLIVVNCIIMGRAEAYAGKNGPVASLFDGIGMGLGFTAALCILGAIREFIGAGTLAGVKVMPASYVPVNIFVLAPGAFLVLGFMVAFMNKCKIGFARRTDIDTVNGPCCGDCASCMHGDSCGEKPENGAAAEAAKGGEA